MTQSKVIIAELCQNHNGNFNNVLKMVDAAKEAGATHVKIQNIYADMLHFRPQFEYGIEKEGKTLSIRRPFQEEYNRLKSLELTENECKKFIQVCRSVDITPLTTCFSHDNVTKIRDMGFLEVKVASYDCGSHSMIKRLCQIFEKIHISTGASFDDEIRTTAQIVRESGIDVNYFHCVTLYPTPLNEMHLSRMAYLREITGSSSVGLSDHSLFARDGLLACMAALALGATSIERHFRLEAPEKSRDGPVSIDAQSLRELVDFSRLENEEQNFLLSEKMANWQEVMSGTDQRQLSEEELLNRDYYRGRFGSARDSHCDTARTMIMNWEHFDA